MSFRKEVRAFMDDWRFNVRQEITQQRTIDLLRAELIELRKVNKDLLDRLMARNFEELKVYQESDETGSTSKRDLTSDEDETNAGEIV